MQPMTLPLCQITDKTKVGLCSALRYSRNHSCTCHQHVQLQWNEAHVAVLPAADHHSSHWHQRHRCV